LIGDIFESLRESTSKHVRTSDMNIIQGINLY